VERGLTLGGAGDSDERVELESLGARVDGVSELGRRAGSSLVRWRSPLRDESRMRATSSLKLGTRRAAPLERREAGTGSGAGGADDGRRKCASTRARSAKISTSRRRGSTCVSRAKRSAAWIAPVAM
jgi:hypothetical protein